MNQWIKTVNRVNASRYTVPEGWSTREQVAVELECDPEKVGEILKPAIAEGAIERQDFSVWNDKRRRAERATCYRILAPGTKPATQPSPSKKKEKPAAPDFDSRVRQALIRHPGATDAAIAHSLFKTKTADVVEVRRRLRI